MSRVIVALLLGWGSLLPAAYADDKPAPVYEISATGTLEIGPDGSVTRYELDKQQPMAIEQALGRNIEQWRFEPITVDGKPVVAKTRMRLSIQALPLADQEYQLRIASLSFGEPQRNVHDMKPPRYPDLAVKAGLGAKVLLVLQLDAQGKVGQAHPEQVSLDYQIRNKAIVTRWREVFARASAAAAMGWRFDPGEIIGGEPVGTSVRIPVEYTLSDTRKPEMENVWRRYIPGPLVPAPWIPAEGDRALASQDVDSLRDGDMQSLDSRFRPKDALVGSLL